MYGCQLIQSAGVLLRLPQVAMATAQVLFQRFWYVTSMKHFSTKVSSVTPTGKHIIGSHSAVCIPHRTSEWAPCSWQQNSKRRPSVSVT